jgi:hypothetical protein
MSRSPSRLVPASTLLALALAGGCQLLIGLDEGKGSGPSGSSASSTSGSSSSSASSSASSSSSGAGGTGGMGTGGTGGSGGCSAPADCPDPMNACLDRTCNANTCGATPAAPTTNGQCTVNGHGGICGDTGAVAGTCVECNLAVDCVVTNYCALHMCIIADCIDGVTNGPETDLDCGGPTCAPCGDNLKCLIDADCISKICDPTAKLCTPGTCSDTVQNQGETGVDCGGPSCGPCPTVLLLAGGTTGPNGLMGGVFHPGGAWAVTPLAGVSSEGLGLAFLASGKGVGLARFTGAGNALEFTTWSGAAWSAPAPLNTDTTQGQPTITAAGNTAQAVYWGLDFKYYFESYDGQWTSSPQAVKASGMATQPCGPSAAQLAPVGTDAALAFINGSCTGALNHLVVMPLAGGAWQGFQDIASNPNIAASPPSLRPAVTSLVAGAAGPDLLVAYVQAGGSQIAWSARTGGSWSPPTAISNALTNDPVALSPLPGGGAVMAFKGTDKNLYYATYTAPSTWSMPAAVVTAGVMLASPPALSKGMGGDSAELAYVDLGAGAVFHARYNGTPLKWQTAVQVGTTTGFSNVALAAGP